MLNGSQLQQAALKLSDVTGDSVTTDQLPAKAWENTIETTNLGLPKMAQQQVRVYQRYCYLNRVP
jgi:hypothetical protein